MNPQLWFQQTSIPTFQNAIRRWFRSNSRDLPWRGTRDPYRVLVSEIMLQQTTVATVQPAYVRFLSRFPTIADLARTSESEVVSAWEGLGYYRRARNLFRLAELVMNEHGGVVPTDPHQLEKLPGLGKYSAHAVACFSSGARLPILEANTFRLWSRLVGLRKDPKSQPHQRRLWQLAEDVLPHRQVGDFNQALMDLGSQICTPKQPKCIQCPVRRHCRAFQAGQPEEFPKPAGKPPVISVEHCCLVVQQGSNVLVSQRPEEGLWSLMWEFPSQKFIPQSQPPQQAASLARKLLGWKRNARFNLVKKFCHRVTRYRVTLWVFYAKIHGNRIPPVPNSFRWVDVTGLSQLPMSTPHRKIANLVQISQ
jgi:A/G-specific adenine glycosylase